MITADATTAGCAGGKSKANKSKAKTNQRIQRLQRLKGLKMSIATVILGESGTGKSAGLRNMSHANTLLIQSIRKPLPFRSDGWKDVTDHGNIYVSDQPESIIKAMRKTTRDVIVIDDFQYILANEFMRRVLDKEVGNAAFAKYNEIARNAWDIFNAANQLAAHKRVYILAHTDTGDDGTTRIKTIGKLIDSKIGLEGMVTIVLRTAVMAGDYRFRTRNSGADTVKTPMGMFDDDTIENDLAAVDAAIVDYYQLAQAA